MSASGTLKISSRFENLEQVALTLRQAALDNGLEPAQADEVEMAVDEAVTNIIEHAYRGSPDGEIVVTWRPVKDELVIHIQDYGRPFEPGQVHTPRTTGSLSRRTVGGLGLFFMRKLMDRVEFRRTRPAGNLVILTKRVSR